MKNNSKLIMSTIGGALRHHWLGVVGIGCVAAGLHGLNTGPIDSAHASVAASDSRAMVREKLSTIGFSGPEQVREISLADEPEAPPAILRLDNHRDNPEPVAEAVDQTIERTEPTTALVTGSIEEALADPDQLAVHRPDKAISETTSAKAEADEKSAEPNLAASPIPQIDVAIAPTPAAPETKIFRVKSGDSLAAIFKRAGLPKGTLPKVLALEDSKRYLRKIHPGDVIRIALNPKGGLDTLSFDIDAFHKLIVFSDEEQFASTIETASRETRVTSATGRIDSSLFLAAKDAGLSDNLVMGLVDIFAWDIDFAQDLRNGDHFSVVYEEILRDGKKISDGRILAAEFVNQNNQHRAVRFEHSSRSGFYDPDGKALRKAFLRNAVKFSRISSRFKPKRWHPILKKWRAHRGVDYAARTGTPVRATGDGRIKTIGWVNGYGRVVMIQHGKRYLTVYGHLSKFARGLKKGSRVRQGQLIAYVGKSGYATGPHLHYEFRVDGKHRDPLKVKLPGAPALPKKLLTKFRQAAAPHLGTLDRLSQTLLAKNEHN